MTNNPNLIPTPIVDVTGKQTTVYRKGAQVPQAKTFPSPMAPLHPEADAIIKRMNAAVERLHEIDFMNRERTSNPPTNLQANLLDLARDAPDMLDEIVDHIAAASEDEKTNLRWALRRSNTYNAAKARGNEDPAAFARETYKKMLTLHPIAAPISVAADKDSSQSIAQYMISGAESLLSGEYGEDYADLKAAVIVLGIKNLNVSASGVLTADDNDREQIRNIAKDIDSVVAVLPELIERRSTDPELVSLLVSSPRAIMEGHL